MFNYSKIPYCSPNPAEAKLRRGASVILILIVGLCPFGIAYSQPVTEDSSGDSTQPARHQPQKNAFLLHLQQASDKARAKEWPTATVEARTALDAAYRDNNEYEVFDAATFLAQILQVQEQYAKALDVIKELMAWMYANQGRQDGIQTLSEQAIGLALAAGQYQEVTRLQNQLIRDANAYPGLWTTALNASSSSPENSVLTYSLAKIDFPLTLDGWVLVRMEPANRRDKPSRLTFARFEKARQWLSVDIEMTYREDLRGLSREQMLENMRNMLNANIIEPAYDGKPQAVKQLPTLPFLAPAIAVKGINHTDNHGEKETHLRWIATRDDWMFQGDATFAQKDEKRAYTELSKLAENIHWSTPGRFFREKTMKQQSDEIDAQWSTPPGNWDMASKMATSALQDAVFPEEIGRLHAIIGISQFRQRDLSTAQDSLKQALAAWSYDPTVSYGDEWLSDRTLDYAADIAWRQGHKTDAIALNTRFINANGNIWPYWKIAGDDAPFLQNIQTGMRLPLRVANLRLRPDGDRRYYYEDLLRQNNAQIGLTVEQQGNIPDDVMEKGIRDFLAQKLSLMAQKVVKQPFQPHSVSESNLPIRGQKWIVEIAPQVTDTKQQAGTPGNLSSHPAQMMFWIVDRGERRSILRIPVGAEGFSEDLAIQLANSIEW